LDLSLLSQLWALNESIQGFRTMLQEQEKSPSASNSDLNSFASDDDEDVTPKHVNTVIVKGRLDDDKTPVQRMRTAPPAPPSRTSRPV
jgi:hypothetical protein